MKIFAQTLTKPLKTASTFADLKSKFLNAISNFQNNTLSTTTLLEHFITGVSTISTNLTASGTATVAIVSSLGKKGVLNIYYSGTFFYTLLSIQYFRKTKLVSSFGVIVNTAIAANYHHLGVGSVPTAYNVPATHSIYFRLTGSPLTLTANVTTTTTTPTSVTLLSGVAIEDIWVQLSIEINSAGNTAYFYVHNYSGTLLASTSISITGFIGDYIKPFVAIGASSSMSTNTINIDYIYAKEVL